MNAFSGVADTDVVELEGRGCVAVEAGRSRVDDSEVAVSLFHGGLYVLDLRPGETADRVLRRDVRLKAWVA